MIATTPPDLAPSSSEAAGRTAASPADAFAVAQRTVAFFERHAGDSHATERLCRADTSVHIDLGDGVGLTLRLDRRPLEAEIGRVGSAEVELRCSPEQLAAHMAGERSLALAIMHGEVAFTGPVRKFLSIAPIIRGLSRGPAGRDGVSSR